MLWANVWLNVCAHLDFLEGDEVETIYLTKAELIQLQLGSGAHMLDGSSGCPLPRGDTPGQGLLPPCGRRVLLTEHHALLYPTLQET